MYSLQKCCFPSKKTDIPIKDKETINEQNEPKTPETQPEAVKSGNPNNNIDNTRLSTQNEDSKIQNNDNQDSKKEQASNSNVPLSLKKEDPVLDYMNSHRQITEEEIKKGPILTVEEESNGNIFQKKQLKINAGGLIGGRGLNDGVVIFGQENSSNNNNNNNGNNNNNNKDFKCDFNLNFQEQLPYPYLFAIYYQNDTKKFYIQAYKGQGVDVKILFIKLAGDYILPLRQKEIISAGNVIFQISPIENNCMEITNLSIKDPLSNKRAFDPTKEKEVTIGRDKKCHFSFPENKSFSKVHTSFIYNENSKEWVIQDGTVSKSSTNGTWVFGMHSFEIKDQMVVEILTSKVKFYLTKGEI